jgi:hypothetical protein
MATRPTGLYRHEQHRGDDRHEHDEHGKAFRNRPDHGSMMPEFEWRSDFTEPR